ncbi:hypothetical protein Cgig2_030546 [Carnegiea gigantea]|uniref:Uncharacterized protein n=1 Tax=Carnegiea gigantea TaxID=171969 RepID=A0A9Q1GTK8_9CARY|nr:hypothetical protein Cgig2_030546 [Carnegiea gigantea]
MNHAVADGTAFWHFWNTWSEIHEAIDENQVSISRPPVHDFLFPNDRDPEIWFPFTSPNDFGNKHKTPQLLRANKESNTSKISSLQALTALVWRSITRANLLSHRDQVTKCGLSINNRPRLDPPLPPNYFRSLMDVVRASTTVGELLEHNLGWAALLVHQAVANQTDKVVRESMKTWLQSPCLYERGPISLMMTMSPRFEIYGNGFGLLGKPLAARNGCNNTYPGNVVVYPGYEGGGSMDLEVHLPFELMEVLESDKEFMDVAS